MLSQATSSTESDAERRATLARVYLHLIEKGRQRKKQAAKSAGDCSVESLLAVTLQPTMQEDPECPSV